MSVSLDCGLLRKTKVYPSVCLNNIPHSLWGDWGLWEVAHALLELSSIPGRVPARFALRPCECGGQWYGPSSFSSPHAGGVHSLLNELASRYINNGRCQWWIEMLHKHAKAPVEADGQKSRPYIGSGCHNTVNNRTLKIPLV
ncbi:hypothetical protein PCH_Pc20g06870 [Penicillium rubens Wisconsin 54-1255]|uniref:Uncharacterized protein n=1 Tax=Penicillium rubens (strain ATCC 28089 / DSM 1075 / NRRL 1951 / Wisconsin 54-1255) TaxID=500485 RepID=B6HDB2_PENRW|nr:hypothetical protein PCH_Pc20g06870 [Penicillium rubens Wisconsin 54-1255]